MLPDRRSASDAHRGSEGIAGDNVATDQKCRRLIRIDADAFPEMAVLPITWLVIRKSP